MVDIGTGGGLTRAQLDAGALLTRGNGAAGGRHRSGRRRIDANEARRVDGVSIAGRTITFNLPNGGTEDIWSCRMLSRIHRAESGNDLNITLLDDSTRTIILPSGGGGGGGVTLAAGSAGD